MVRPSRRLTLFDGFDGLNEFDLVDFYQHESNWSNRMILGDSLQVMGSLAEREGLRGKVQMIYLDPPYGIKFGSNWQMSTRKRDVKDGKMEDATFEVEQIKAFRDTWELGIHSYLTYLRDRLMVARDLLTESGSIFVQIGDENVHLVRSLLDEVFGSENFVSQITVQDDDGAGSLPAELSSRRHVRTSCFGSREIELASSIGRSHRRRVVGDDGACATPSLELTTERRAIADSTNEIPSLRRTRRRCSRLDQLTSDKSVGAPDDGLSGRLSTARTFCPAAAAGKRIETECSASA